MVQIGDQQFPTLSASSIKRAHAGNISRPLGNISRSSGNIPKALPFKEVPNSGSAIPMRRGPYPILVPLRKKGFKPKGAYPNEGSIPPNAEFYEKRIPHQKIVVPPKGISMALHKNGVPHENVALYGNRAS
ncbi:hypothetical protein ACH5RR_040905 [Cinchona calisaya]|uniref:Uncharacterized protein n=1 Tax=Cinchona calisaya TaxID=153742 RepID=A0ABD2XTL5_9GENT